MVFTKDQKYNVTFNHCGKSITQELTYLDKIETFGKGIFEFQTDNCFVQNVPVVEQLNYQADANGKPLRVDSVSKRGKLYTHFVPFGRRFEKRLITTIGIAGGNIEHCEIVK